MIASSVKAGVCCGSIVNQHLPDKNCCVLCCVKCCLGCCAPYCVCPLCCNDVCCGGGKASSFLKKPADEFGVDFTKPGNTE